MGSSPPDDYYALLGVAADATRAELRRAWRQLAVRLHPDRAGIDATAEFQRIHAAYVVLSDPAARAAYDLRRGATAADATATSRRRAPGVMLWRLSGPLNSLLACGVARVADEDLIELFLDAEEAEQGGMVTISMRVRVRCLACDAGAACARCGSRGTIDELFSAWLSVPPEAADGAILVPSVLLPGMARPVRFRLRVPAAP